MMCKAHRVIREVLQQRHVLTDSLQAELLDERLQHAAVPRGARSYGVRRKEVVGILARLLSVAGTNGRDECRIAMSDAFAAETPGFSKSMKIGASSRPTNGSG